MNDGADKAIIYYRLGEGLADGDLSPGFALRPSRGRLHIRGEGGDVDEGLDARLSGDARESGGDGHVAVLEGVVHATQLAVRSSRGNHMFGLIVLPDQVHHNIAAPQ